MSLLKKMRSLLLGTPFERSLKAFCKKKVTHILIPWNRGLGDIAIALFAVVFKIREKLPKAHITFLTRPDLAMGFQMLSGVDILIDPKMVRGEPFDLESALKRAGGTLLDFDGILPSIDIERDLDFQIGKLIPQMEWKKSWNGLCAHFGLSGKNYIFIHLHSETAGFYDRKRNFSFERWKGLLPKIFIESGMEIVLVGYTKSPSFDMPGVIDLRGKTNLLELLDLIANHAYALIAPDSGVLCMVYSLARSFPVKIISLWGSPRFGILKFKAPSPNSQLLHIPLIGAKEDIDAISDDEILTPLLSSLCHM